MVSICALAALLSGCGRVQQLQVESKTKPVVAHVRKTHVPWSWLAAELDAYNRWLEGLKPPTGGPWLCISQVETGGIPAMGPTYWTSFGLVTGIIEEYGTPEQQAAVFGGYASFTQQLDIAVRFAEANGFGGWGWRTREVCHL